MSSQEENLELTRQAVSNYNRGDLETVLKNLHEDCEVYMPKSLPNAGTFRGHDGFLTWLGNWMEAWDDFTIEIERIEPVGDRHVVADMRQRATGKGSGVPVEMRIGFVWEIKDGKFLAQHLYPTWDEAMAVALDREGEPAPD